MLTSIPRLGNPKSKDQLASDLLAEVLSEHRLESLSRARCSVRAYALAALVAVQTNFRYDNDYLRFRIQRHMDVLRDSK